MDAAIFNIFRAVQAEEDAAKREDLKARSNKRMSEYFGRNLPALEELAYDLLNVAWRDTMAEDLTQELIEVKTIGLADIDYVEEDLRGGRAYWQGKGGQIVSDIVRYERTLMPRAEMVTALDFHVDEIATDFWGAFGRLVGQAQEKLRQLPTTKLIELVQQGILGGTYFGQFAASTLTDDQVDSVLEQVALRADGRVSIVGTRVAIRKLTTVGLDFGQNVQERIFDTGIIARYKGYPVVQVENFENFEGNYVLPNDELWLVGRNAGRLVFYGNQAKVQQLRQPSFMTRWETARDAGILLYGAPLGRVGRIRLT